jgi:diadenosine tetraphosphate (Ap4A) HIT family hydrolase
MQGGWWPPIRGIRRVIGRVASPADWPAHDPDHWPRLARSAGSALEQLRDASGLIRRDSEQSVAPPEDLATTALVSEALIDLVDSQSSWATREVREAILQLIDVLVDADVPAPAPDLIPRLAAHTCALVRAHLIDRRQFELGRDVDQRLRAQATAAHARLRCSVLPALLAALDESDGADTVAFSRAARALSLAGAVQDLELSQQLTDAGEKVAEILDERRKSALDDSEAERPARAAELMLCAAGLADLRTHDHRKIELALLEALDARSADDEPITGANSLLGYDIATAACRIALALLDDTFSPRQTIPDRAVAALIATVDHADEKMIRTRSQTPGPARGWSEIENPQVIAARPTLAALTLVTAVARLAASALNLQTLKALGALDPKRDFWPDYLRWEKYREESEPERSMGRILEYLDDEVIRPRTSSHIPPWRRPKATSVLLFGPPGTTKTTIVRAVAEGLGWPLISLSPGNFISDGLEHIEAEASRVFGQIHSLSQAVVLFDECDELFRYREPDRASEQLRGIAAFTTASMLPKLQDLFDRGQVVFFILTNFFRSIDPAIRRSGRIEHIIGVGPPDEEQRLHTIRQQLAIEDDAADPVALAAARKLAALTDRFVRGELVLAAKALRGSMEETRFRLPSEAEQAAYAIASQTRPGLSLSEQSYAEYRADTQRFSAPHLQMVDVHRRVELEREAAEACALCAQMQGRPENDVFHADRKDDAPYVRVLAHETVWGVVMPSIGPITDGHVLLLPKQHLRRTVLLAESVDEAFDREVDLILAVLTEQYGSPVHVFEHGSRVAGRMVCSIDHAHLHFVPLAADIAKVRPAKEEFGTWRSVEPGLRALRAAVGESEYLYYRQPDGECWILSPDGTSDIRSQLLRQRLAEEAGYGHRWNWREHPQIDAAISTYKNLLPAFLQRDGVLPAPPLSPTG